MSYTMYGLGVIPRNADGTPAGPDDETSTEGMSPEMKAAAQQAASMFGMSLATFLSTIGRNFLQPGGKPPVVAPSFLSTYGAPIAIVAVLGAAALLLPKLSKK